MYPQVMWRRARWIIAIATVCAAGAWVPAAQRGPDDRPRLRLHIRPAVAQAPGWIKATAFVERNAANRSLTISAGCEDYFRSSAIQIDGADAPRAYTVVFGNLPQCNYDITARLHRNDGEDIVDVVSAQVRR
jgi:hypothetical protein